LSLIITDSDDFDEFKNKIIQFRSKDVEYGIIAHCLMTTIKYPVLNAYLEEILKCVEKHKINSFFEKRCGSILHFMIRFIERVSFNSFQIIIGKGADVNIRAKTNLNRTPLHELDLLFLVVQSKKIFIARKKKFSLSEEELPEHVTNIIRLFVENGANLNLLDNNGHTVMGAIMARDLTEINKCIITALLDHNASYFEPNEYHDFYEFIQSQKLKRIKPAKVEIFTH
jgi:ribosome biogenesis protein Nip4